MATRTQITPAKYLATSFPDLDREYVHGEIVERDLPIYAHGFAQGSLVSFFLAIRKTHQIRASVEQRLRLMDGIVRIADVAVFAGARPEPVPTQPPLAVVEVVSPHDLWNDLLKKLDEYARWGVPNIWLVDLDRGALHIFKDGSIFRTDAFRLPGYPIEIRFEDLIDTLD